jgi:RNA-directed DNA polymerase
MTVATTTGAASREPQAWHAINWRKAHREVRRLQARIVKATQEGRWGKVKALQRLLSRSYSAKTLAVKRVTENEGKRTPGVDGVLWDTPQKKAHAVQTLRQRGYHPQPLRRVYIEKEVFHPTEEGTPQGGVISPVLANMALDGLEKALKTQFAPLTKQGKGARVNLIRFADDFVITGGSPELLEQDVKPLVAEFLRKRGLTLSDEKTHITAIEDEFDFLGQQVRKYHGKLLIKPSRKSIQRLLTHIRTILKTQKTVSAGVLIAQLNPIIRGWAHYHQHVVSKQAFAQVDNAIFLALWRWAKRRHPHKGKRWIRRKYFKRVGPRAWVFFGDHNGKEWRLFFASRLPIKRHIKIKADADPYDPAWELYFEERLSRQMEHTLRGARQLDYLWREQNGSCPVCQQKLTDDTRWHNHHIVWRSRGGPDTADNRVLLHPNCHRQVHSQHLFVEKPRPSGGV